MSLGRGMKQHRMPSFMKDEVDLFQQDFAIPCGPSPGRDNGKNFSSLLNTIAAYAEGFSADPIIRRALNPWKKLEQVQ